jgi:hypothetical protein
MTTTIPAVAPYHSCIVCFKGDTTIGLAFRGEAEWILAGVQTIGIPEEQAYPTLRAGLEERGWTGAPGEVPGGEIVEGFRLCRECAASTPFHEVVREASDGLVCVVRQGV